jgi:predicted nucleotidyltransferase component of viral defense system
VIPRAHIVAWRQVAPWVSDAQVEQDLIMSRALVVIFGNSALASSLAFRGGTALHKLYLQTARRYSEDIDLVQITPGPIGPILDALKGVLNSFLGEPKRKQAEGTVTLTYRTDSEGPPVVPMRLKIEINTREHFSVTGFKHRPYEVQSLWFQGSCRITTFSLEELLGTKVRALYQRRKGRDLFDLWLGLTEGKAKSSTVIRIFGEYMKAQGLTVKREDYEKNLQEKIKHQGFASDLTPLLPTSVDYGIIEASELIRGELIAKIK